MVEKEQYKILVVEANEKLRTRMYDVLTSQGMEVICENSSIAAIETLENPGSSPYALIVSSYRMPKMQGDEILKKAREVSPDTRRILVSDAEDLETMVRAVNSADIHGCFVLPLNNDDFIAKVNLVCRQFDKIKKHETLKKVIRRQNKQMFKMAADFKKKHAKYSAKIEERKKKIRILKSIGRHGAETVDPEKPLSLEEFITKNELDFVSEAFGAEFLRIAEHIRHIFTKAASGLFLEIAEFDYKDILKNSSEGKEYHDEVNKLLPLVFMLLQKKGENFAKTDAKDLLLDEFIELSMSENMTKAFLKIKKYDARVVNLANIKEFLVQKNIKFGIRDDNLIGAWLSDSVNYDDAFVIAEGKEPQLPKDAEVTYYFPRDFLKAGKVNDDGSIDFKDRGDIPFISKGVLLAEKVPMVEGAFGRDVLGDDMPVPDAVDFVFGSGTGTVLSEDGAKIYADSDGQPHLDAMGNVSVFPELNIEGDVGYETGNINFDGNVVVKGVVKEGFSVKCATLTASQIEGAQINLTGDLNVSAGIIDAHLIKVQGNVQAKYINNSRIDAFGDLIVEKEIIDSIILLSGACMNSTGTIISSMVTAKMGVDAGRIGTDISKPAKFRVGVDDHIKSLLIKVDKKIKKNLDAGAELKSEISEFKKEDEQLHIKISEHAYTQDRNQVELNGIKKKMPALEASGNMEVLYKVTKAVEQMQKKAKEAENEINSAFARQDAVAMEISRRKGSIKGLEESNRSFVYEKKGLKEFSAKDKPVPEVRVNKKVAAGTKIDGPNSSRIIREAVSRCRILEVKKGGGDEGGLSFYEM
ncbi:MAG: flagellar assembly protein A, partial [Thermodesulfobacteriota bacterium]|nr:flagellar assembly protein A [Thermodesulfobacteriota bacterium]